MKLPHTEEYREIKKTITDNSSSIQPPNFTIMLVTCGNILWICDQFLCQGGGEMATSDYIRRWVDAMENEQYDSALSVLDEGLQTAATENNTEEIARYTNLKKYTHDMLKALTSHKESNPVTLYCSMCGKGEADGCILVAGAECVICDGCIKICLGIVDTKKRELGRELECSFCGKKQSEVSRIIAGPGVSICDNCCNKCAEILARDSD